MIDPTRWPWWQVAACLAVGALAWVRARDDGRDPTPPRAWVSTTLVCVLAASWWTILARRGGPVIIPDTVRDLSEALGIARFGRHPSDGPAIPPMRSVLSPVWYYILALPLRATWDGALQLAVIAWQTMSAGALFTLVRRLFGATEAWVAVALFLCSANVLANFDALTHSNLLFLVLALGLHALVRAHMDGRSAWIVAVFFWLSLACQLHAAAVVIVPVAVVFALRHGRDAAWPDVAVALLAGLAPILPTFPTVPGLSSGAPVDVAQRLVGTSNAIVPTAIVALVLARPRSAMRPRVAAALVATLIAWGLWALPLPQGGALRLFNVATAPVGSAPDVVPMWDDIGRVALSAVRFGAPSPATDGLSAMVAIVLLGLGAAACVPVLRAAPDRSAPQAGTAWLALAWAGITVPAGLALTMTAGAWERYLSVGAMAMMPLLAVGVTTWWRWVLQGERRPSQAGALVWGAIGVATWASAPAMLVGAVVGPWVVRALPGSLRRVGAAAWITVVVARSFTAQLPVRDADPARLQIAEALASHVLALPGMDVDGAMQRVHMTPDLFDALRSASTVFVQRAALDGLPASTDARHWRVLPAAAASRGPDTVPLGSTGFVAEPYTPALRRDEATVVGSSAATVSLPFRFQDLTHYPTWMRPHLDLAPRPLLAGADGVVVDLRVPRDLPADPRLNGVVVVAVPETSDRPEGAPLTCAVTVEVDDTPLRPVHDDGHRGAYALATQSGRVTLHVVVRGCALRVLDVYDAPVGP